MQAILEWSQHDLKSNQSARLPGGRMALDGG
jgi:hypothetical protein